MKCDDCGYPYVPSNGTCPNCGHENALPAWAVKLIIGFAIPIVAVPIIVLNKSKEVKVQASWFLLIYSGYFFVDLANGWFFSSLLRSIFDDGNEFELILWSKGIQFTTAILCLGYYLLKGRGQILTSIIFARLKQARLKMVILSFLTVAFVLSVLMVTFNKNRRATTDTTPTSLITETGVKDVDQKDTLAQSLKHLSLDSHTTDNTHTHYQEEKSPSHSKALNVQDLFEMKTKDDLIKKFGGNDVEIRDRFDYEGLLAGHSLFIFPNTKNEAEIYLTDNEEFEVVSLCNIESDWQLPYNIKLGMTLKDLEKINEAPIEFYNFETDLGGIISSFTKGRLAGKFSGQLEGKGWVPSRNEETFKSTDVDVASENIVLKRISFKLR